VTEIKPRNIGKRIALALAAIAIGIVVWLLWPLFFPMSELIDKILCAAVGLRVMTYLTYRWSGKTIALVVAIVFIALVIWVMVTGLMLQTTRGV